MNFGDDARLYLLWLLPILLLVFRFAFKRREARLHLMANEKTLASLVKPQSRVRLWLKAVLILTAVALMIVGLARPRWGFEWRDVTRKGVDIMIALDVSRSMLAEDIEPNRLKRAQREIIDLIRMLKGDRIGLLAFAGVSFVQCPLTVDYSAVNLFLDHIDVDLIPVQGTSLGDAIRQATASLLEGSPESSTGKAIILITDGEDQDSNPLDAAKAAREAGVKIFAVGVGGDTGAPIPEEGGGFKKDANGNLVMTKLDGTILQQIAKETGGAYVRSSTGDMDLERIYLDGIKGHMAESDIHTSRQKIWYERFFWFVLAAFILLTLEYFLPVY